MSALLLVSVLTCAVSTTVIARLMPSGRRRVSVIRALIAMLVAATVTVSIGVAGGIDAPEFLLGLAVAAAPISLLLGAAADDSFGGTGRASSAIVVVWAAVVFPVSTIVPPLVLAGCASPECRVEDFGGALPLLVSSAASALLAWGARASDTDIPWRRFMVAAAIVWACGVIWLVSLEGAIDAYTPKIFAASVLAPLGGAVAWLMVDVLRGRTHLLGRSAANGALAGFVAIIPGAATLSFPWSLVVGALAGIVAGLVYGSRRLVTAGRAGHWALVVLCATAVGYFAPAVSGDTIGFIFSGRIGALVPPLAAFGAVAVFGILVTAPVWIAGRRRAAGRR